jgi:hypothetical protein
MTSKTAAQERALAERAAASAGLDAETALGAAKFRPSTSS